MSDDGEITMHPVGEGDLAFLRRVFFSSWDRALAAADWAPDMKEAVLDQQFAAQTAAYLANYPDADHTLILVGDKPAGRLYLHCGDNRIALIDITLLPDWRNRGIGSTLVRNIQAEAARHRRDVELHVEKWNPDARRLYLRLGFLDTADIGTHWKMAWSPAQEISAS